MTKHSRKRTAGQWILNAPPRHLVEAAAAHIRDVVARWADDPEVKRALHRRPHRKPNFGWPFDNVNAIILKSR